jgi:transposase
LTEEQRRHIIALYRDGQHRQLIADKIPCSLNTVNHWIQHYQHSGNVEDQPRAGRPRTTDENTDVNIVVTAAVEKFIVPEKIKRMLDLDISPRTIRRRVDEADLFGRISRKEFPFTEQHIQKRLSFAHGYGGWSKEQWACVLYSDETLVELTPHGPVWVQRPIGAAFDPAYISNKELHPERVCVWGCFARSGVGDLYMFDENLEATLLIDILRSHLIQSAKALFPENTIWWVLHDRDPKYQSALVQQWLFNKGIQCIEFPPHSPDLNPIENLWSRVKHLVEEQNPADIEELKELLDTVWHSTSKKYLRNLSDNMSRRCQAVIANKGHITKY